MSESTKAEAVLRARATYPGPPLDPLDDAIRVVLAKIDRLGTELKEATESRQRLILDNACWQAENRDLGNELVVAKDKINRLEKVIQEEIRLRRDPTWDDAMKEIDPEMFEDDPNEEEIDPHV